MIKGRTTLSNKEAFKPRWYVVDANGQILAGWRCGLPPS